MARGKHVGAAIAGSVVAIAVLVLLVVSAGSASAARVTADLEKATAAKVVKHFSVGAGPDQPAYDPVNHYVYVPEPSSHQIQVFKSSDALVASIPLGPTSFPGAAAFDEQDNYVYVTDSDYNCVYVISGTTIVGNVTGSSLDGPFGIAYDPGEGGVIVANNFGDTVSLIVGIFVEASVVVGTTPWGVAYDPFYATILVTNYGSNNVTVLSAVYLTYDTSTKVGADPTAIMFDPADELDYVSDFGANHVSLMYGNGYLEGTLKGFSEPDGMAFSQAQLEMYITNAGTGKVFVVNGATIEQKISTDKTGNPVGAVYDSYNDDVYVTEYFGDDVYVLS